MMHKKIFLTFLFLNLFFVVNTEASLLVGADQRESTVTVRIVGDITNKTEHTENKANSSKKKSLPKTNDKENNIFSFLGICLLLVTTIIIIFKKKRNKKNEKI